ncbi:MAG: M1 family aminopeptidase [Myxococcota bacterium]|nr:M1 family aminopeptidase [Myxococcota bacterium]
MTRLINVLSLSLALLLSALVSPAVADDTEDLLERARRGDKNAMELFYISIAGSELDFDQAFKVGSRNIEMAWANLELDGGWVVPLKAKELDPADLEGIELPEWPDWGFIYVGKGRFKYTAPTDTERWLMNYSLSEINKKYSDEDGFDIALKGGVAIFAQGKWRDQVREGAESGSIDKKSRRDAEKIWRDRHDLFASSAAYGIAWDVFSGRKDNSIGLEIPTKDIKGVPYLSYRDDRGYKESMGIFVMKRYALNRDSIRSWSLGSWFPPELAEGKTDHELGYLRIQKTLKDIQHYDMKMNVYRDADEGQWGMEVEGSMEVEVLKDNTRALSFAMMSFGENEFDPNADPDVEKTTGSNPVVVRSVKLDGERLDFLHKSHKLIILLPREYAKGEKLTIDFSYGGLFITTIKQPPPQTELSLTSSMGAIAKIINWRVPNDYPWFPQADSHSDSFTFDWELRLPAPMLAATSGTLVSMTPEGKTNVHIIKERTPVTFPAILFGRLSVLENEPDYDAGEYKIRIYLHPGFEKDAQSFLDEAAAVIRFYEQLFGKYPFQELDIAQMPLYTGYAQAPAGLIQMDGLTYISKTDLVNLYNANDRMLDIRDNFVPHEIAHEWWGHKAGWGSSRDQWVSETFAEYAAALFIEERERQKSGEADNTEGYSKRKDRWGINGRLGHTFKRTGPVWVGNRVGGRRTSTIYARGPLVLDQLRENFGKEVVLKMMYAWCELAAKNDGRVVTEDLQVILEKIVPGVGFEEFMKQYIKGNAPLPTDPKRDKAKDLGRAKY